MLAGLKKLPAVLNQFGFERMRAGQEGIVRHVLGGADVLGILPTAGGKSATWQIPMVCHGWRALVFCPLTALIQDQVQGARALGIRAASLSGQNTDEMNALTLHQWEEGELDVVFSVPERIRGDAFTNTFRRYQPDLVVVDEAHTIAQWGDTFRTAFSALGGFLESLHKVKSVMALTATAGGGVADTICTVLRNPDVPRKVFLYKRDNLKLSAIQFPGAAAAENEILRRMKDGPVLVYCATQKNVERIGSALAKRCPPGTVGVYHGGLPESYKADAMNRFMSGHINLMIATNAFGMGINKADIRHVIHYDQPGGLEAWLQETGRGGRDGKPTWALTMYSDYATKLQTLFIKNTYPVESDVRRLFGHLQSMVDLNGEVNMRTKDLAAALDCDSMTISTMVKILESKGCVTKTKISDDVFIVKFLAGAEDPRGGKSYKRYREGVMRVGQHVNGTYAFTMEAAAQELKIGDTSVRTKLVEWDKVGLVQLVLPEKGNTYKVRKDMTGIDLSYLALRRSERLYELDTLMHFLINVPDEDRHEFCRRYFDESNRPKS